MPPGAKYEASIPTFPGSGTKARHAPMPERTGEPRRARALFAEIARGHDGWRQNLVPEQREWFELARRKLG